MKKAKHDELRSDYSREDLGRGVRGKYLKAYRAGTNLVSLKPEDEGVEARLIDTKRATTI